MSKRFTPVLLVLAFSMAVGCVQDVQTEDTLGLPVTRRFELSFDEATKTALGGSEAGKRSVNWLSGDRIFYFTKQNVPESTNVVTEDGAGYIEMTLNGRQDYFLNALYSGMANDARSRNPIDAYSLESLSFGVEGIAAEEQSLHSFADAHACAAHLHNLNHNTIHFYSIVSLFKFSLDDPSVSKVVFSSRTPNQIINGGPYGLLRVSLNTDGSLSSVIPDPDYNDGTNSIVVDTGGNMDDYYFSVIPSYFADGFKLQCYEGDTLVKEVEYKKTVSAGINANGDFYPNVINLGKTSQWKTGEEPPATVFVEDLVISEDTIGADGHFYPGDEVVITATVLPSDAYNPTLSWTLTEGEGVVEFAQIAGNTQDVNVVTLKITALQAGTAKLKFSTTGMAVSGQPIEKTCVITVSDEPGMLDGIIDLSEEYGTANCYIAPALNSVFKFPANVKGNSTEAIYPAYATVLWETHQKRTSTDYSTILPGDVIENVEYNQGYIVFKAVSAGNALIAAHSSDGTILWSWHIWVWPGYDEVSNSQVYVNNAGTMMDRNLGAMNSFPSSMYDWSTWGLMYQWGRKDPFFGRETTAVALNPDYYEVPSPEYSDYNKGTVHYTVKNPMTYLLYPENNAQDWMYAKRDNTLWGEEKTMYDPCPPGWKVPGKTFWVKNLGSTSMLSYSTLSDLNPGLDFTGIMARGYDHVFYPAQGAWLGIEDYSYPGLVYGKAFYGYYWTSGINTSNNGGVVMSINRTGKTLNPNASDSRASAFNVRCMKEGSGNVLPDPIPVSKVTVSPDMKTLQIGYSFQLSYTIEPSNADTTTVTWSSSDPNIATVDNNGLVKAVSVGGPVTIMAKANDESGKYGVCVVTVEDSGIIDLSVNGTANCYLVSEPGDYCFKAVRGNSTSASDVLTPSHAALLWETYGNNSVISSDVIKDVEYSDGFIYFNVPADKMMNGNAVIAAYDSQANIIWSWHIWVCNGFDPEACAQVYNNRAGIVMDRNLGALSATPGDVGTLGLLFQWGRKDPFLGSSLAYNAGYTNGSQPVAVSLSISSWGIVDGPVDISYTISHPLTFICVSNNDWQYSTSDGLWDGEQKTIFDPCPPGWMVPKGGDYGLWATATGTTTDNYINDSNTSSYGVSYTNFTSAYSPVWIPYAGYRAEKTGVLTGTGGYLRVWSGSGSSYDKAYMLYQVASSSTFLVSAKMPKAEGCSVRCVKET